MEDKQVALHIAKFSMANLFPQAVAPGLDQQLR